MEPVLEPNEGSVAEAAAPGMQPAADESPEEPGTFMLEPLSLMETAPPESGAGTFSSPKAAHVVPQRGGPRPVWRSLLFPQTGQRALSLGRSVPDVFASLSEAGVQFERQLPMGSGANGAGFDLVLEDWSSRGLLRRRGSILALLAPRGRWVAVVQKKRWSGLAGFSARRRARREGFETIETFYAHPSLWSPQILVPLDRREPFQYFLQLAMGVHARRRRAMALGLRLLWSLGLHREVLPNLIVVARRKG